VQYQRQHIDLIDIHKLTPKNPATSVNPKKNDALLTVSLLAVCYSYAKRVELFRIDNEGRTFNFLSIRESI
jgi:hypothetical protein